MENIDHPLVLLSKPQRMPTENYILLITSEDCHPERATAIVTSGAGGAVANADLSATFDALTTDTGDNSGTLNAYSEGGLNITVNDGQYSSFDPFNGNGGGPNSGFFYGSGGNSSFVTISSVADDVFSGLEFLIGHGNSGLNAQVVWETRLDGSTVSTGTVTVARGSIFGLFDSNGFDEVYVGASAGAYTQFGQFQSIALDDLSLEFASNDPVSPVPLPATLPLLFASFAVFGLTRRSART